MIPSVLSKHRFNTDLLPCAIMSGSKQKRITTFFSKSAVDPAPISNHTESEEITDNVDHVDNVLSPLSQNKPGAKKRHEFQDKWLETYPWLLKNDKGYMNCRICTEMEKSNPFTGQGCSNFRTSTLKRHMSTSSHQNALKELSMRSNFKTATNKALQLKNESLLCALKTVVWLATEDIATSKYASLMNLMCIQGCQAVRDLANGKNATYTSHTIAEELQESVCEVLTSDIKSSLEQSQFVSVLMDESTDISVSGNLVIYLKTVGLNGNNFEAQYHFAGNHKINEKDAQTITDKVNSVLKNFNVPSSKIVCVGSDGASVMMGKKAGVAAKMRENNPKLLNIHCVAHRLALCTSQAASSVPGMETFRQTLTNLYYYFKNSSVRTSRLEAMQQILDNPIVKVKELHAVRWFSMYSAILAIYKSWEALVSYFENCTDKDPKAIGLQKQITQVGFVHLLYFLMDVIPVTTRLNMFFQKDNIDISAVQPAVQAVIDELQMFQDGNLIGHYQEELKNKLVREGTGVKLFGHELLNSNLKSYDSVKCAFIVSLIENLNARFPKDDVSLISAFDILTLKGLSHLSQTEMAQYGTTQMTKLVGHYSPEIVTSEQALSEFTLLKRLVLEQAYQTGNMVTLWSILSEFHEETFPNLCKLAQIALCLPVNTAICERGFSTQNVIKTSHRNRITDTSLNRLMTIKIQCPPLADEKFTDVAERSLKFFKAAKDRRIFHVAC